MEREDVWSSYTFLSLSNNAPKMSGKVYANLEPVLSLGTP